MENKDITRRIDELGRVVLSIDHGWILGWKEGDTLILRLDEENQRIIVAKENALQ